MDASGLKTKLEFIFNIDDLIIPTLDFIISTPIEKNKIEIFSYKKNRKYNKKNAAKLF